MTNNISFELEQAFKAECKVIDLKQEYSGYRDDIRWAIATDLAEETLREKYFIIIKQYEPFMVLTMEHARVFVQYHSNERKHKKRNINLGDAFGYEDGELEKYHPELIENPFNSGTDIPGLDEALELLEESQRERIKKYYYKGMNYAEIAAEEGVTSQAVQQSMKRILALLEKNLEKIWGRR